jgi:hypothetical protein
MVNLSKDFGHLSRFKELPCDLAQDARSELTLSH